MNDLENNNTSQDANNVSLLPSVTENINKIKSTLGNSNDIIFREVFVGKSEKQHIAIIHTDGLANETLISDSILQSLTIDMDSPTDETTAINDYFKDYCLSVSDVKDISDFTALYSSLLSGDTIILFDKLTKGFAASTKGAKERAVSEPVTETVIRGPRESFTENLRTNTALVRRKIKSPNLWIQSRVIGQETQTDIAVMYMNGIANEKIVQEVLER